MMLADCEKGEVGGFSTGPATADGRDAAFPRPRRVLMIAPTSFFADYGCHVRIVEQAWGLRRRGQQVVLCTYPNGRDLAGLDVRRIPSPPGCGRLEVGSSWRKLLLDVLLFVLVWRTARRERPDVLHGFLHEGALIGHLVGWLLGIPAVFDFQGSLTGEMIDHGFLPPKGPLYALFAALERWIDRRLPIVLANSRYSARLLSERFAVPAERVRLAPDGVDVKRFAPGGGLSPAERTRRRAALGLPAEAAVIVYLGLLAPYQGIDLLLQAAAGLTPARPWRLLVMGFPNEKRYRRQAEALGLGRQVLFTGPVPYEEAQQYLALGDIAVGPKLSETEGSGKLLNYMAMGLPTVAFDTPVSREYLGEDGVLAPAGNAAALGLALQRLIDAGEDRTALGGRLRRRAEAGFAWEEAMEAILAAHALVCRRARPVL